MKVIAEFVPRHLEKALDVARHIATFARLEFTANNLIRMRLIDPAKVVYMDIALYPEQYKSDAEFDFGVNLNMLYKLMRSLDNDQSVEIEADESIMKITQLETQHTIVSQVTPTMVPSVPLTTGSTVKVPTKLFQKYIRALSLIAPAVEINYVPQADVMFLEAVNSMYRTMFSISTNESPSPDTETEEYRKRFMLKFIEAVINPGLGDFVKMGFGDSLYIAYKQPNIDVEVLVSAYTEG